MSLASSFLGTVTVKITGASLPSTLDAVTQRGIQVGECRFLTELEAQVTILRKDFPALKKICGKKGDCLTLIRRRGLYWTAKSMGKRPVLIAGLFLCFLATLYLPARVLFVRVEGNQKIPTRQIMEAAEACGIRFGASRRAVRSEKMKNALLGAMPELQWAGVNTVGCVAKISVRERSVEKEAVQNGSFGHVAAAMDGVILDVTVIRGTPLCAPGQAVSAGQVLISGYTDCGLSIRAEQADGEIFAATRRHLQVRTPVLTAQKGVIHGKRKKLSLLVGKKRINLWKDSGIWDTVCDRIYEEYYITLPGGFRLPFGWSVERFYFRETIPGEQDRERMERLLSDAAEGCLKNRMVSGTIRDRTYLYREVPGALELAGEYSCVEMIGFRQRLEIGE